MMRLSVVIGVLLLALSTLPGQAAVPLLPEHLELDYTFNYGSLPIGKVTRILRREDGNTYYHSMWTRPIGIARALTHVELFEQGRFQLIGADIHPLSFTDERRGDGKAYRREVVFDWRDRILHFNDARQMPMALGMQDQSTVLYWFMMNPLPNATGIQVPITNGKDVDPYTFVYAGKETLESPFGPIETIVVKRLSQEQVAWERQCKNSRSPAEASQCDQAADDFTVWIAPSKHNIAIKLRKRKNNQVMTLTLDSASGL